MIPDCIEQDPRELAGRAPAAALAASLYTVERWDDGDAHTADDLWLRVAWCCTDQELPSYEEDPAQLVWQ